MTSTGNRWTIQNRWQLKAIDRKPYLLYYGVRNPPRHRDTGVEISHELAERLSASKGTVSAEDIAAMREETETLIDQGVLVVPERRLVDKTPETMQTCTRCVTNDYIIPGLEFNEEGIYALCQCYALADTPPRSFFPTVSEEELRASMKGGFNSRFDAMVLYTGGKDSSYLLWLLARKLGLRVVAAFWNMPYCSDAAYENIKRARERLDEVEFVEWTLPLKTVRDAMRAKWQNHGWPCLCPTAAFPLLYPLAAQLRVPYVFLGIEDVQAAVMNYVVAPSVDQNSTPPTPRQRTLAFLAARAFPRPQIEPVRWPDEMANYHAAVRDAMPDLFQDLAELTRRAQEDSTVPLPIIACLKTNEEYGAWSDARTVIEQEMDWRAPAGQKSLLHTSCAIEPVKDYLQFQRFKTMRTVFMPQAIVEMGAAVNFGLVRREDALEAVQELGYWKVPSVLDTLTRDLGITPDDVKAAQDELQSSLCEWANLSS
jgi:hypothetical protein